MTAGSEDLPRRSTASRVGAAVLAAVGCGVWFGYVTVILAVLPTFLGLFHGSPQPLPRYTIAFIYTMEFIRTHGVVFLSGWAAATAAIVLASALAKTPRAALRAALFAVASFGLERAAAGFAVPCLHAPPAIIFGADELA